jgi:hypothetical protein
MKNKYSKLSDAELNNVANQIYTEQCRRRKKAEAKKAKTHSVNGITAKDICVFYSDYDSNSILFQFYIKHDGKMYDIYYDGCSGRGVFHPWWPVVDGENGVYEFIPNGFSEAMENCYEYNGTTKEAIAQLKKHGIKDVRAGNVHDLAVTVS